MAKEKWQKDKQWFFFTKHAHKTKARVTRTQLNPGELKCSGRVSMSFLFELFFQKEMMYLQLDDDEACPDKCAWDWLEAGKQMIIPYIITL